METLWLRRATRALAAVLLAAGAFAFLSELQPVREGGLTTPHPVERTPARPSPLPETPAAAAAAASPAQALHDAPRGALRTDSLKINEVPPPGAEPKVDPVAAARAAARAGFRVQGGGASTSAGYVPGPNARRDTTGLIARGGADGGLGGVSPAAASGSTPQTATARTEKTAGAANAAAAGTSAPAARAPAAPSSSGWSAPALSWLGQAKSLRPASLSETLERGLMSQIASQQAAQSAVGAAIAALEAKGQPVTEENIRREAGSDVFEQAGVAGDEKATQEFIETARNPPPPADPKKLEGAVKSLVAQFPKDASEAERLARQAERPKQPIEAPPKDALALYQKHKDVFDKAQKEFGVKPDHILGILRVESGLFRNMGTQPVAPTLWSILTRRNGSRAARQANRDLAILPQLEARGDLGPFTTKDLKGSSAGAISGAQFLPSSVAAYGRSPDGKGQNLFDQRTAIYSIAHYLKKHGYQADNPAAVRKAIFGYNHADWYVDKVLKNSVNVSGAAPQASR